MIDTTYKHFYSFSKFYFRLPTHLVQSADIQKFLWCSIGFSSSKIRFASGEIIDFTKSANYQ